MCVQTMTVIAPGKSLCGSPVCLESSELSSNANDDGAPTLLDHIKIRSDFKLVNLKITIPIKIIINTSIRFSIPAVNFSSRVSRSSNSD